MWIRNGWYCCPLSRFPLAAFWSCWTPYTSFRQNKAEKWVADRFYPAPVRVRSYLPVHSSHEHTPQSHRFLHLHTPEWWKGTQTTTATYRLFAPTFFLLHSALSIAACVVAARSKYWNTRYYICSALVYFLSRLQARGRAISCTRRNCSCLHGFLALDWVLLYLLW